MNPLRLSRLPYVLLVLYCVLAVGVWLTMNAERRFHVNDMKSAEAEYLSSMVQRDLALRIAAVKRMAKRWDHLGGMSEEVFTAEARNYFNDMPGFRALSFTDQDDVARYVVPRRNSQARGRNIAAIGENRRNALRRAEGQDTPSMTPSIELLDGSGSGFVIFVPVRQQSVYLGSFGAVFHVQSWLRALFLENAQRNYQPHFEQQIRLNDDVIFQSGGWDQSPDSLSVMSTPVDLYGQSIVVGLRSSNGAPMLRQDRVPEIVAFLLACIALAIGGMIATMRLAQSERLSAVAANLQLNDANAALAQEVEIRREAETRAIEASESKSRFLATMSHEVRTPINAIMGMFELIQSADVPERQRRQAAVGRSAAERLLDQLNAVLEISKLRAKAVSFHPREVDLKELCDQWRIALEGMVRRSGKPLDYGLEQAEDVPMQLHLDDRRTHQIVTNLLDNAVKYTERGSVQLQIGTATTVAGRHGVTIDIADTGPGIPQSQVNAIFDRFVQVDNAIDRAVGGTGLGLAIAKDLAEAMDMDLTLHKNSNSGCVFRLFVENHQ
ncbi:MAG: ATP-binding protein [Pseudomonadota bacterium]